mgnify:CR=1 FL=1
MQTDHSHTPAAIAARLAGDRKPTLVRDFVYGGIDGVVTTFAVVAGVEGASLSPAVVLILGAANLLADGFSMAASNYSGTKAVIDEERRARETELLHIERWPEGEREEVRQLLAARGLSKRTLEGAVADITADKENWVRFMLTDEYGFAPAQTSPLSAGLATFAAFLVCGAAPLAPFALGLENGFAVSTALTAVVFFVIGAWKANWSPSPWWRSGLETLAIGSAAAGLAYGVGWLLRGLAG